MSWSRQGELNDSYCISQTGRQPAIASPIAVPRIPASARGVSTQRSGPKRSRNPAVARKTPPARLTSSPMTITFASRSSSTWKQSLTASTKVRLLTENPPQLGEVALERGRWVRKRAVEEERDVRGGFRLGLGDSLAHRVRRLGADLVDEIVTEHADPPQVPLVAPH